MTETYLQQLINYVENNISKGYTLESLKWALIEQGYSRSSVKKAVKKVNEKLAKKAPKLKEKPRIKVEKEPILKEMEKSTFKSKIKDFFRNLKDIITS